MFEALSGSTRVRAWHVERGGDFSCPNPKCGAPVVLKHGPIVRPHFAHKRGAHCDHGHGETPEHRETKFQLFDAFSALGRNVAIEPVVAAGDSCAIPDLVIKRSSPPEVAVEIQHSPVALDEIEGRTRTLRDAGFALWWVVPLDLGFDCLPNDLIERYAPRPYERWLHELYGGRIWYFDLRTNSLVQATFEPSWIVRESFYGVEVSFDGEEYESPKWVNLRIGAVFQPGERELLIRGRKARTVRAPFMTRNRMCPRFSLPACRYVDLKALSQIEDSLS